MSIFAEVDKNSVVVNIAVFDDGDTPADLGWTGWHQTTDGPGNQIAGPGDIFVPEADGYPSGLFHSPSPHNTWVLDDNYEWQPPADKPYPEGFDDPDRLWWWDDAIEDWDERFRPEGWVIPDPPEPE